MSARNKSCLAVCVAAAVMASSASTAIAQGYTWNVDGGGSWNTAANWTNPVSGGTYPDGTDSLDGTLAGGIGRLTNNITGTSPARVVTVNGPITLSALVIGDSGSGTDRSFTVSSGPGSFTFKSPTPDGGPAVIIKNSSGKLDTIDLDVKFENDTNISVGGLGGLTFGGDITGSGKVGYTSVATSNHFINNIDLFTGTFDLNIGASTLFFDGLDVESQDGSNAKWNIHDSTTGTFRWANNATVSTNVFKMGELSGNAYLRNEGSHPTTLQIGNLNTNSEFSGIIANGGQPPALPGNLGEAVSLEKIGTGVLTLSGNNTYQGTTTVNGGTLLVNGTHVAGGAYTVNVGGKLGGKGTIGSNVSIVGGTLAPGASIGTLGIGGSLTISSGTFDWEFSGGGGLAIPDNAAVQGADLVNVAGALSIGATANLTGLNLGTAVIANGIKFTVIAYNGTFGAPGTFAGKPDDSTVSIGGNLWTINYDDTTPGINGGTTGVGRSFVTLTAVPEASSILVIGLGSVFALGAVRLGKRFGCAAF